LKIQGFQRNCTKPEVVFWNKYTRKTGIDRNGNNAKTENTMVKIPKNEL